MDTYSLSIPAKFGIGFEEMFDRFSNLIDTTCYRETNAGNFPPYNIINESETESIIEMAVAGFSEADLDVVVDNNVLKVSGNKDVKLDDEKYQHQGIAYRNFERQFALSEYIEVNGASVADGILRIYIEKILPDNLKPRKINIVSDSGVNWGAPPGTTEVPPYDTSSK